MSRTLLVTTLACMLHAGGAAAQPGADPSPGTPPEHLGIGGYAAVGIPAAIVAARFSVPFHPRAALDLDVGRSRASGGFGSTFGASVRWLRRERQPDGFSDYGIIGVLVMDAISVTDIRFPNARVRQVDRHKRLSGQMGYGFDGQARNGTRVGFELVGGGSEMSGPRLSIRVFAVWGPEAHTYRR